MGGVISSDGICMALVVLNDRLMDRWTHENLRRRYDMMKSVSVSICMYVIFMLILDREVQNGDMKNLSLN